MFFPVFRPNGVVQDVSYTGTAGTTTNPVSLGCTVVRLLATSACYVTISNTGNVVTATTANGFYLPATTPEYVRVNVGDKISAIQVSASGTLNVAEMQG